MSLWRAILEAWQLVQVKRLAPLINRGFECPLDLVSHHSVVNNVSHTRQPALRPNRPAEPALRNFPECLTCSDTVHYLHRRRLKS